MAAKKKAEGAAIHTEGGRRRWRGAPDLVRDLVEIESITPHKRNARKRTPRNVEAIRAAFDAFGQQRPFLVYTFPGDSKPTVIAGNGGFMVAGQSGWTHVAVTRFAGTPDQAEAYAIADNRTAELSEWDRDVIAAASAWLNAHEALKDLAKKLRLEAIGDGKSGGAVRPEVEFTTELLEESNYILFAFTNELDWKVVVQHLGIKATHSLKSRPGFEQIGIGRVLDGKRLLEILNRTVRVASAKKGARR